MGGMMGKLPAYLSKRGGAAMEETAYGLHVVVHMPTDTAALARRVAQAHADAIIAKVNQLNCCAERKRELIEAIGT